MAKQVTIPTTSTEGIDMRVLNSSTQLNDQPPTFHSKQYEKISNCLNSTKLLIEELGLYIKDRPYTHGEGHEHHVKYRPDDSE